MSVFSIYKKGQGRYVRMGTVAGIAIMLILGIRWVDRRIIPLEPSYIKAIVSLLFVVHPVNSTNSDLTGGSLIPLYDST